jgi:hypothetical protein
MLFNHLSSIDVKNNDLVTINTQIDPAGCAIVRPTLASRRHSSYP